MKRSGRVFIIAGVALALVAGALLFMFLSQMTQQANAVATPTPVPDVDVMTLTRDLPAGTIVTGDMLKRLPRKGNDPAIAEAVRDPSEAVGRMVVTDMKANQTVKRLDLQALPFVLAKGKRAMAISVDDLSSVAGLVREGDFVDVVISGKIKLVAPTPGTGAGNAPAAKPGGEEEDDDANATVAPVGDQTTVKAVLQRVPVLKIVQPPAPQTQAQQQQAQQQTQQQQQAAAAGTPVATPASQPPQGRISNAKAILVLAVSDQEAELLRFANDTGGLQLLLRGRDDLDPEQTKGMTLDILIRDYGLPVPRLVTVDGTEPEVKPTPKP
jgi:pilus assembly protein CpaB